LQYNCGDDDYDDDYLSIGCGIDELAVVVMVEWRLW
jgi:hypothetical protein